MTFDELQNLCEPYGFTVRKMYSNWLPSKKPDMTKMYMASVSLEKSEFPTWIDGICISVEFILDNVVCCSVYHKVRRNDMNEFYMDGKGKMITDPNKVTKEFITDYLLKTLDSYNKLKMDVKLKEIESDFV